MKKKKTYIPLPEGCEAFRGSWILGLTVTFGEIALVFLGIFIPVSVCAALKEHNPSFCAFILLVAVLLLMAYGTCAEEAWGVLSESKHLLKADTLIHGDYCLPNVLLDGWKFSGFIDLGNSGVADRHIDLFWGAWTLGFNLHTDMYRGRFFDAYGRDRVDEDLIRVVAAAEVFG